MSLTDDSIFPYGKHLRNKTRMEDVPAGYLLHQHSTFKGTLFPSENLKQVLDYVDDNYDVIQKQLMENTQ